MVIELKNEKMKKNKKSWRNPGKNRKERKNQQKNQKNRKSKKKSQNHKNTLRAQPQLPQSLLARLPQMPGPKPNQP